MYDAPFDALTRLGWATAAAVLVVFTARALRVELRGDGARVRARVVDVGLDAACTLVVLAFVAVLTLVVNRGLAG